jgi:hypothetical protein
VQIILPAPGANLAAYMQERHADNGIVTGLFGAGTQTL